MIWIVICGLATVVLLVAERKSLRPWIWVAKPTASAAFVVFAVVSGAGGSAYGRWILAALVLSWIGDVALIPPGRAGFLAGLGAFLVAHLAFAAAFLEHEARGSDRVIAAAAMAAAGVALLVWLRPHLPPGLRLPVAAYVVAIAAMVVAAAGATGGGAPARLLPGAVAFALSDVFVARHRFVVRSFSNKVVGLPLYYAAQLLLASTV